MLMLKLDKIRKVIQWSKSIVGKKIGMTQIFSDKDKVVPVTAIDVANWIVTDIKTTRT